VDAYKTLALLADLYQLTTDNQQYNLLIRITVEHGKKNNKNENFYGKFLLIIGFTKNNWI
jgi:hypothetical protein